MRMDAEIIAGNAGFDHFADNARHLKRLRAAIGVAQHHPARAGFVCGFGAGERVFGVGLVAVKEMLAVDQHFLASGGDGFDRVGDVFEILLIGAAERDAHMVIPALGDKADRSRLSTG